MLDGGRLGNSADDREGVHERVGDTRPGITEAYGMLAAGAANATDDVLESGIEVVDAL